MATFDARRSVGGGDSDNYFVGCTHDLACGHGAWLKVLRPRRGAKVLDLSGVAPCGWVEEAYVMHAVGRLVASVILPATAWATGQIQKACALHASQWVVVDEGYPLVVDGGAHPHGQG